MSKTYSMAGWRMGFAVGNRELIAALTRVKSYLDYGAFTPIQAAACAALNGPQDVVEQNRLRYQQRRDVMVESFARAGWEIPSPPAAGAARSRPWRCGHSPRPARHSRRRVPPRLRHG